jgi:small subunit ribosomal protein S9
MAEVKKNKKNTTISKTTDKKPSVKKPVIKKDKVVLEKEVKAKTSKVVKPSTKEVADVVVAKNKTISGKYIEAVGRRKTAVAQVRMYEKGQGNFTINGFSSLEYFKREENSSVALQPLKLVSKLKDFDFSILVKGGGVLGQIDAIRHGIARALVKYDPEFRAILKVSGYITRDPRKKERKKPGLKKARKAPQWSKR